MQNAKICIIWLVRRGVVQAINWQATINKLFGEVSNKQQF